MEITYVSVSVSSSAGAARSTIVVPMERRWTPGSTTHGKLAVLQFIFERRLSPSSMVLLCPLVYGSGLCYSPRLRKFYQPNQLSGPMIDVQPLGRGSVL